MKLVEEFDVLNQSLCGLPGLRVDQFPTRGKKQRQARGRGWRAVSSHQSHTTKMMPHLSSLPSPQQKPPHGRSSRVAPQSQPRSKPSDHSAVACVGDSEALFATSLWLLQGALSAVIAIPKGLSPRFRITCLVPSTA